MNIKVDFDNIVVKEDKNDFNVKVLMLKGEKGEAGATSWGAITGTLSNQTDLKNALDGKANQTDFNTVSGQVNTNTSNISTINGQITDINGELDDFEDLFYGNATVNDENTSITLENTVEAGFESFDLKGNTTQDGTPTPTNPIPVNVVTGNNTISVCGKNLISSDDFMQGTFSPSTGGNNNVSSETTTKVSTKLIDIELCSSLIYSGNYFELIAFYTKDLTYISYTSNNPSSVPATAKYCRIRFNNGGNEILVTTIQAQNNQLENGTTATTYEPYTEATYLINLPEGMELCKIGNYQDYFYKDSGKWYLHKETKKSKISDLTWYYASSNSYFYSVIDDILVEQTSTMFKGYSTIYTPTESAGTSAWGSKNNYSIGMRNTYNYLCVKDTNYTNATDFTNARGNGIVYYVLATPTNTEITYQPLIDQLNLLEQATSKENQTNISQVNNDLPFIIYAEAFANTFNGRMEGMDYKIDNCEVLNNKVTSITSGSTDSEYPSAKAVYDLFNSITDGDEVSY